jgi:hypothetical protein
LSSQKKDGKTDAEIIKDTVAKTGIFMFGTLFLIFVLIFVFVLLITETNIPELPAIGN